MKPTDEITFNTPLTAPHGWNAPGEPVTLYTGAFSGFPGGVRQGKVELTFGVKPGLKWSVELRDEDYLGLLPDHAVATVGRTLPAKFMASHRRNGSGWTQSAEAGDPDTPLQRIVAQWMNLPLSVGNGHLEEKTAAGVRRSNGRSLIEVEGWTVTIDQRFDLSAVLRTAADDTQSVLTHVMELKRTDDKPFSVAEGRDLLECLRVSLSFGFGRKVAPVLPVGYGADGIVAWEQWFSPLVDSARTSGMEWLFDASPDDCADLLSCAVRALSDRSLMGTTRLQMAMATQAVSTGFVEQRILAAAPVLESLAWSRLVLGGLMTRRQYRDCHAEDRLRYLLDSAGVPTTIDAAELPALAQYAAAKRIDGPTAVTRIRNHLVHPEVLADDLYAHKGLAAEIWRLSLHYVTLLLLHSIGYRGSYQRHLKLDGWVGDTEATPWTDPATAPAGPIPLPTTGRRAHPRRASQAPTS
ncbi:hypothetical protein [Streptomyces sp. BE303]|uniref:hypothetical protein n=1 Tax=Streptomyces sp. BE303 TaxID=3002528 RepID=UPI002E784DC9|nr:hypothetical protein [Streptomyces sp. BE303]MED7951987.1 hypothetical protein [Streptomyces sp. BE303]